MNTPVNGITFLPALLRDWLQDIRTDLGLPAALTIASAPAPTAYALPLLEISCPSFRLPAHDRLVEYTINVLFVTNADGEPAGSESDAAAVTRRAAAIAAENDTDALVHAALSLQKGQELGDALEIPSFFDWCDDRTQPVGEDGFEIQSQQAVGQSGSLTFDENRRTRTRVTTYLFRMITNEFTN